MWKIRAKDLAELEKEALAPESDRDGFGWVAVSDWNVTMLSPI
jgi:hypothetical protein